MSLLSLVQDLRGGRAASREALAESLYPRVAEVVHSKLARDFRRKHRWILAIFSTGDIVQDVFLRILDDLEGRDFADDDAVVRYVSGAVHHRVLDTLKHHLADKRDARRRDDATAHSVRQPVSGTATPAEDVIAGEFLTIYQDVLESFDERERLLLTMRIDQNEGFAVIARQLDYSSESTAGKAYREAFARLLVRLRARGVTGPQGDPS